MSINDENVSMNHLKTLATAMARCRHDSFLLETLFWNILQANPLIVVEAYLKEYPQTVPWPKSETLDPGADFKHCELTIAQHARLKALWSVNQKIAAIKECRSLTTPIMGLKDAKDVCELWFSKF